MSKNYIDRKTLEKVLKKWENAKKTNYATSAFWKNEKDKLSKLIGKKAKSGELIGGVSRLTKTKAELLNRELNIIAKSKLASKHGFDIARKKQRDTLIREGYVENRKEAIKFQKIIGSDIFKKIADNLEYMNYGQAMKLARSKKATVKNITKAWDKVEKMKFKNPTEKADYFFSLLKEEKTEKE